MNPMWKPSQFNVIVQNEPEVGQHLLYNTLSRAVALIDDTDLVFLNAIEDRDELAASGEDAGWQPFLEALHAQGFVVPKAWNEGEAYLDALRANSSHKGGRLEVTLLTNLSPCILNCVYCFEKGTHRGERLKGALSENAVAFIKSQCLKLEVETLWVSYYGGEPLSYSQAIFETATTLQQFCREHRIAFQFGMVTSGYLLTRQRVEQLLPLGFVQAQVTIDGPAEVHDKTRPLRSGKGTYDRIMENLDEYAGAIHTDILSVVDKDRVPAVYQLIDTLAERGFADRRVRMKFSPESPDYSPETLVTTTQRFADEGTKLMTTEKQLLVEIAKLSIYANERGLFGELLPQRTWCAMQRHDERHLVIEPDGTLRTCPNLIGRAEEYKAGHLSQGVGGIDLEIKEKYQKAQQCLECKYLPICADCRVDALAKKGDILASNSHEEEYDAIVPLLVKAYYQSLQ